MRSFKMFSFCFYFSYWASFMEAELICAIVTQKSEFSDKGKVCCSTLPEKNFGFGDLIPYREFGVVHKYCIYIFGKVMLCFVCI